MLIPPQYQLAAKAAGLALVMAAGALAWDRFPLIGPAARIAGLQDQLTKAGDKLKAANATIDQDKVALQQRDDALKAYGGGAAAEAADAASFWRGQCRAAFEAGYASKSCAVPSGGPSGGAGGVSIGDGVRHDLRSLWEAGAYRPGPAAAAP